MSNEPKISEINNKLELKMNNTKETNTRINSQPKVQFEDLLPHAGNFGRYQIWLFVCTMPFYIFGGFMYFSQLFMTEVPSQHWCWIPELENLTAHERRMLAIPLDENGRYGYSQCSVYAANWTEVLRTGFGPSPETPRVPCQNGWEFNKSEIPYPTISMEMGWVCDQNSYQATAQSIFFLGAVFGGFLLGWLSDKYGRLPAIVISNLIGCLGGIISIFARNFMEFSIYRFFTGMAYDNCMMMAYLLVLEYVSPKYRSKIGNISFALFYSLSVVALPWISLACGHWKTISIVTSLPLLLAVLAPVVLLESPKWLMTKGRVDEALAKLMVVARVNKKTICPKLIEQFKHTATTEKEESGSLIELLKRPPLRNMFILICIEYMCCSIVFDALARSIGQLDFDFFLSFSLISVTEFPSLILVAFIMDRLGRRWLVNTMMFVSFLFSVLIVCVGGGLPSVMCAVVARFSVNMAYNTVIQWGAEMLPTSVRGSGLSVIHICGYVSTMISPYIVYLENVIVWLPLVLSGCVAALGSLIALWMPDTAKKDMPQSFDDAEELTNSQRFWDMPCLRKKVAKELNGVDNFSCELEKTI